MFRWGIHAACESVNGDLIYGDLLLHSGVPLGIQSTDMQGLKTKAWSCLLYHADEMLHSPKCGST